MIAIVDYGAGNLVSVKKALDWLGHECVITNDPVQKILNIAMVELDSIPYYFKSDEISSYMRINPSPITSILEKLDSAGFNASRTSLNPTAFKTNANRKRGGAIARLHDVGNRAEYWNTECVRIDGRNLREDCWATRDPEDAVG